jgi:mono/diheme cytochrome c family protein
LQALSRYPHARWRGRALTAAAGLLLLAAGCGREEPPDLVNGKKLYTSRQCASCHALARANAKGTQGPSLDAAFGPARRAGIGQKTIQGIVHRQIEIVRRGSIMPANLVKGDDARDVAAYVAEVAGVPGKDTGPLALVGPKAGGKPAVAKAGKLQIDMDPTGALAFVTTRATADPGPLTLISKNPSSVQHNIALKGLGIDEKGAVVGEGGNSEVEAPVKRGNYTFYCSVPGHEAGGMKGTLRVN